MTQQSPPSTQDDFLAVQFPVGLTEAGTNVCAVVQPRVLVHARLCLGSSAWCASFLSNFLSTCARLNCFLYVIDSHLIWTPSLFLFWHFPPVSPSRSCPPLCTHSMVKKKQKPKCNNMI